MKMQEIFPCPKCGAQNVIGQEFCQSCRQRFQYNCPFCGVIVNATMVNCPACRESLYWPTPHKVKPFPKRPAEYQEIGEGGAEGRGAVNVETTKPRKKGDLWLTGCLGLVILGLLAFGVYFVYNNFIKEKSPVQPLPPATDNETGLIPTQFSDLERA